MINGNSFHSSVSPTLLRDVSTRTQVNINAGIEVFPAGQPVDSLELGTALNSERDMAALARRSRIQDAVQGTALSRPVSVGQAAQDFAERWSDHKAGSEAIVKFTEGAGRAAGRMIGEHEGGKIFPILAPTIGGWIGASRGAEVGRNFGAFLARTPLSGFVGDKLRDMQGLGT